MRISDWSSDVCSSDLARFSGIHWGAIAASLILGLTIGLRTWMPGAPVAIDSGTLVAAGPLAEALDTQLASKQPGDAAVRIVLSFEDTAGRSEEPTSELQSLMRISDALFCLKQQNTPE